MPSSRWTIDEISAFPLCLFYVLFSSWLVYLHWAGVCGKSLNGCDGRMCLICKGNVISLKKPCGYFRNMKFIEDG